MSVYWWVELNKEVRQEEEQKQKWQKELRKWKKPKKLTKDKKPKKSEKPEKLINLIKQKKLTKQKKPEKQEVAGRSRCIRSRKSGRSSGSRKGGKYELGLC
ncbi:7580_t:CDS:1 [Racocetra persica]|uniref:7580_t:CDS:1 n=1 Tax=Racocetra persica TaxID=160502 RepID=A0ACA9LAD7_9GLOM|nr:7580_t:CDS:1 [Racocetra persica]